MRKLLMLACAFSLGIVSCKKTSTESLIVSEKARVKPAMELVPEKGGGDGISRLVTYSNLEELTEIEPGVFWCYYAGVSMKFKNLIYDVTNPYLPTLYGDLYWTDKPNNISIREGSNFSPYFTLDETYCESGLTVNYSYHNDTIPATMVVDNNKIRIFHNNLAVNTNISSFELAAGSSTTVKKALTVLSGNIIFGNYTISITGGICGNWQSRRITGKLFTQVVGGVRKFYVAPMNYSDPIGYINPPE